MSGLISAGASSVYEPAGTGLPVKARANQWHGTLTGASLQNLSNQYIPRADLNSDGIHDGWDLDIFQQPWGYSAGEDGRGQPSGTDLSGFSYGDATYERKNIDNRIGFGGSMWDPWLGAYLVRHRASDPNLRRWLQVDPIGYAGGDRDLRELGTDLWPCH